MESYIRPGCVVLSVYLSMPSSSWEQVSELLQEILAECFNVCAEQLEFCCLAV